jgi:hypothetical protein
VNVTKKTARFFLLSHELGCFRPACCHAASYVHVKITMSFHLRKRSRKGGRYLDPIRVSRGALGSTDVSLRWCSSQARAATRGAIPRYGSVLLALVVVALLIAGLHLLFQ